MALVIAGASGYMGRRTARLLIAGGMRAADLILVSRTPDQLADLAALGARTRYGDFTDPASLAAAFAGAARMFLINAAPDHLPRRSDRPAIHRDAIAAAKAAGIAHVVFLSMIGAEKPGNPYYAIEPALRDSGTRKTAYASRDDFYAAVVAVLASGGHEGQVYNLTGPQYSLRDIAALLGELSGKGIAVVQLYGDELRQDLLARGMDPYVVEIVMKSPGGGAFLADRGDIVSDFPKLIGREARSLREHFAAHRDELLGGAPPAGQEPIFT
ncbi:MAG TPA: NAD(P)H-binding protein [Stellaceae bacterium]|nr:NAD(P)H-binding protein [Stellaceae bacterium]